MSANKIVLLSFLTHIISICYTYADSSKMFRETLASDSAAKYKTGVPFSKAVNYPAYIAEGLISNPKQYSDTLVNFLTENIKSDFLKIKAVHDWIACNVAYDYDAYYGNKASFENPESILKMKRAVCSGFSNLFIFLAEKAGIKSSKIYGTSRFLYDSSTKKNMDHAWNAVEIYSQMYFIDVTYAATLKFENKKTEKLTKYYDEYLLTNINYRNYDMTISNKQFQNAGYNQDSILKSPLLNKVFHNHKAKLVVYPKVELHKDTIKFKNHIYNISDSYIIKNNIINFEFESEDNIIITASLSKNKTEDFSEYVYVENNNGKTKIQFSAPKGISLNAQINLKNTSTDQSFLGYEFKLNNPYNEGVIPSPQNKLIIKERPGTKINDYNFDKSNGKIYLKISGDMFCKFSAVVENMDTNEISSVQSKNLKNTDLEKTELFDFTNLITNTCLIKIIEHFDFYNEIRAFIIVK